MLFSLSQTQKPSKDVVIKLDTVTERRYDVEHNCLTEEAGHEAPEEPGKSDGVWQVAGILEKRGIESRVVEHPYASFA